MNDKSQRQTIDGLVAWFHDEDRSLPIKAVGDAIAAYQTLQSQLTQAQAELAELWSKTGTIINDRTKSLTIERDEAVAACAVMRNCVNLALSQLRESFSGAGLKNYMNSQFPATEGHAHFTAFCFDVDSAFKTLFDCQLSTTCGKAFLNRMKEAEWLLSRPLLPTMSKQSELTEYHRRYDAFQKGGVK